jgi:O-antigen ligase
MIKTIPNKTIIYFALIISLIFTPVNYDALIIPKIIILFALALYLLPGLSLNIKIFIKNRFLLFVFVVSLLLIIQMLIVAILSSAPFEQEFFGRTGRGLGIATYCSVLVVLLYISMYTNFSDSGFILKWLGIAGLISSLYAIMQRQGLDIMNWNSRTNGIIGTLGNPNFQSSFTAMALIPMIIYIWNRYSKIKYILSLICAFVFLQTLYYTQSTQGYITLTAAILVFSLVYYWYRNKAFFYLILSSGIISTSIAIAGMINKGPLADLLYKVSVQSRGDFWRAAFRTANSNPIFGTGVDSFGDSFLIYRDRAKIEMTDNAHNYFLEFAATGGYPLAILYSILVVITLYSFFALQKRINKFDLNLTGIFSAWMVFLLQAIISPGTVSLLVWNVVLSGFLIGSYVKHSSESKKLGSILPISSLGIRYTGLVLSIVGLLIMFPLFKSDLDLKKAASKGDALALMNALTSYPESSVKYNAFAQDLLKSGLFPQAYEMGLAAVAFNPDSVSAWALIFVNPQAPLEERLKAKVEILRLDPMNTEVNGFNLG